ncbi:MAG: hypothetical protein KC417_09925, partial [Myxococcales bacterium]|nr:hypothetical protein [Myxococcales bacterium]
FRNAIRSARGRVAQLFGSLRTTKDDRDEFAELADAIVAEASLDELVESIESTLRTTDRDAAFAHLARLRKRADAPLGSVTRERIPELAPMLLREIAGAASPDNALRYVTDFFAHVGDVSGFGRLLVQSPGLLRRLVALFGASPRLSDSLVRHPESVSQTLLAGPLTSKEIRDAHRELLVSLVQEALPDQEEFVSELRRVKRETTLRLGLETVSEERTQRECEALLTNIAESQIECCLAYATREVTERWGEPRAKRGELPAAMCVVGMGSLAAGELGFGSDLDLLFAFGSDGTVRRGKESITHGELFTRVAQRTMRLLSQPDPSGDGYEADTRLRPDGSRGTLVVTVAAFDRYHEKSAAPWERQALLRARAIAGAPRMRDVMNEHIRAWVLDAPAPEGERIAEMRARMQRELARERPGKYHPKLGFGAIVDVEFIVQFLALRNKDKPDVLVPSTRDALAALAQHGILGEYEANVLGSAYAFFKEVDRGLRLVRPGKEHALLAGTRDAERIARQMRIRERGSENEGEVLIRTWREHAYEVRMLFERFVGKVNAPPEWRES